MGRGGEAVPQLLLTQIQPTSPHPHTPSPPPTGEKVHGPENKEQCPQGTGLPGRERTAQHVSDRSPETELHVHRPSLRKAVRCFLLPMKRNQMLCATLPKSSGPAQAVVPAQLSPELLFPHGHGRRVFRRGGTGRDGTGRDRTQPSLGSAALCPPRLALPCPVQSCSPLLPSPRLEVSPSGAVAAVSPPGLLLPAHPGTALSPVGRDGAVGAASRRTAASSQQSR